MDTLNQIYHYDKTTKDMGYPFMTQNQCLYNKIHTTYKVIAYVFHY